MRKIKLILEEKKDCGEVTVKITYEKLDENLNKLIEHIKHFSVFVMAQKDNALIPIPIEAIYYFDVVDNKTFLYLESEYYRCDKKLYELEEQLFNTSFIRISKNCILNIEVLASVKAQFSGRLEATLKNGERLLVSKHYIKAFREKFKS